MGLSEDRTNPKGGFCDPFETKIFSCLIGTCSDLSDWDAAISVGLGNIAVSIFSEGCLELDTLTPLMSSFDISEDFQSSSQHVVPGACFKPAFIDRISTFFEVICYKCQLFECIGLANETLM
jgi:hypothetical protein